MELSFRWKNRALSGRILPISSPGTALSIERYEALWLIVIRDRWKNNVERKGKFLSLSKDAVSDDLSYDALRYVRFFLVIDSLCQLTPRPFVLIPVDLCIVVRRSL